MSSAAHSRRAHADEGTLQGDNSLFASAIIVYAALLAAYLADDIFLSPLVSALVCGVGFYLATKQSPGFCVCLAACAVLGQILTTLMFGSTAALAVFVLLIYLFVTHHDKVSSRIGTALTPSSRTGASPSHRGFTLKPKRSGRFIVRQNGMEIDCTDSTGKWWDGRQPAAWVMDEMGRFDVKIQTAGTTNPIMVSTECASICFQVHYTEGTGLKDLFTMISRFPDFRGRMAYFSAQVIAPHTLFVFSDRMFTRNWDFASSEARRRQVQQRNTFAHTESNPATSPLSHSLVSMSADELARKLPHAASALMGHLADSHYGLKEQLVADMCRPKDETVELQRLREEGTDIVRNETDPFGDGDQTPILNEGTGCAHAALWAAGGNMLDLVEEDKAPPIAIHFLSGNVTKIRAALASARARGRMTEFLEIRFGLLRSTPLMLVAMGCGQEFRCDDGSVRFDFAQTMQLLLDAGARVDARDLCGKTVLHYLVGPLFKEPVGWSMLRACIQRSRQLQLQPALVDVQDRFGVTIVLNAVMMNLTKLVKSLCEEYGADTTVAEWSGISAHSFITLNGDIKRIIIRSSGRTIAAANTCCLCQALSATRKCAGCNVARYCSQQCQSDDWTKHSQVCISKIEIADDESFVMRPSLAANLATLSKKLTTTEWNGLQPRNLKTDSKGFFEIKVQRPPNLFIQNGVPLSHSLMVSTRHKEICFTVGMREGDNMPALNAKVAAFAAYGGNKAYFFAKHVDRGQLYVSGKQMFTRDW
jgi:hypothetical protein